VRRAAHVVLSAIVCVAPLAESRADEGGGEAAVVAPVDRPAPEGAGARLRRGIEDLESGQAGRAATLFASVARDHPIVSDHADRLLITALLALSQYGAAVDLASEFDAKHADSPLRGEVLRLLGNAHNSLGDPAAARLAWQRARDEVPSAATRAALDLSIAESFERSGRDSEASRAYLAVWSEAPTTGAARKAEQALHRLEASTGRTFRTALDFAKRARAFYDARANRGALASFDRALESALPRSTRRDLQRERAFTLFRLRRYTDAAAAFAELGDEADARFWWARSLARSGRVGQSLREFDRLARGRFSPLAARALFLAGTLREGEEDRTGAMAAYSRVASDAPTRGLRVEARWRLGWGAYQEARYEKAVKHFEALLETTPNRLDRLRARYWRARSLEKLGAAEAGDQFRTLATEYPFSYYGWCAAGRVGESALVREVPERSPPSRLSFAEGKVERIAILIEAGLLEEARTEVRMLAGLTRSLDDRLEVAHLSSAAEDYHRAELVVLGPYSERLARGPEPGREALWWFAWPATFADLVAAGSETQNIDPALLNAVMREESGFRPRVVSTVGARGLTQIMPELTT
jgi:soluble lytic murein transglycosylase